MGEVGLPHLVGALGGEASPGGAGALLGLGSDLAGGCQDAPDGGSGNGGVFACAVPADGVRPGVQTAGEEVLTSWQDPFFDRLAWGGGDFPRASRPCLLGTLTLAQPTARPPMQAGPSASR